LNGIAGRTDVARGIMTRYEGPSGGGFAIDLDVPRGFRGGLHFMAVPAGLQTADRPTWLAALDGSFVPTRHPGLSTERNMHGIAALSVAAPDAPPPHWAPPEVPSRLVGDQLRSSFDGPGIGSEDVVERIVTLDSSPRRVWIHRPNRAVASAPVLVVFEDEDSSTAGCWQRSANSTARPRPSSRSTTNAPRPRSPTLVRAPPRTRDRPFRARGICVRTIS